MLKIAEHGYISALEQKANMPNEMVSSIRGGDITEQGTWIHEKLVLRLARYISDAIGIPAGDLIIVENGKSSYIHCVGVIDTPIFYCQIIYKLNKGEF